MFKKPGLSDQFEEKIQYEKPHGEIDSLLMFYSYDKDLGKLTSEKFGGTIVFKNFNVVCVTEITLKNLALVSDSGELIIFDNNKLCSKFECSLTEKA